MLENGPPTLLAHPFAIVAQSGEGTHLTLLSASLLRVLKQLPPGNAADPCGAPPPPPPAPLQLAGDDCITKSAAAASSSASDCERL